MRDLPRPVPPQGEALLRVRLVGICRTDLELARGYASFRGVPGHEFVADVVEAPADPSWIGKRVTGEINAACGTCPACRAHRTNHCENRTVLGIAQRPGAFAEYLLLPIRNLHRLADAVTDEAAVFAEPLAACCQILQQVPITSNDRVILVGAGKLGQLIARMLVITGCNLQVIARYPSQIKLLNAIGVECLGEEQVPARVADVAIEATGSKAGFALARGALRPGGTLILKSTYTGLFEMDASSLVVDEITLVGSRCGPFTPALQLLESGLVDPLPLVEARYALADGPSAFDHASRRGALKIVLQP